MNEIITKDSVKIEDMIYEIRGKQVILDTDLAKLYEVETKRINEAVRRNPERFPERFTFLLLEEEVNVLRSQIATSKINTKGGRRYAIRVFTEQGVAMLATILKSQIATKVSIQIMDAFVYMRKYVSNNLIEQKYINKLVLEHEESIKLLENTFSKFEEKKVINEIYLDGQIYDAYSKIVDILKEAKKELIIIDGYADKTVLDMIIEVGVPVTIIVKNKTLLKKLDIEKYNQQYNNLKIIKNDTFHDRYIIIDKTKAYHCGASINFAGSKTFSINKLEDEIIIELLLNKIISTDSKNTCI